MTEWRKSTFSGGNTDCVEVAMAQEWVGVRDSKNVEVPVLEFSLSGWRGFLISLP